ncbi:hypothetical protein FRC0546_02213 [Corynebacterium diphtheriae]|nr:hypothetical protein FRC0546_02213 [Corynebacterium diphtheriae]
MALPVLECIDFVSDVVWPWLALVGVGGRATPAHPPKRRHFTPNPVKRPVWKRFGVKFCAKCLEIPPFSGSVEPERPSVARPSGMYGSNPRPEPQQQYPQHPKSCDIASECGIFVGLGGDDLIVCNGNGWLGVGGNVLALLRERSAGYY